MTLQNSYVLRLCLTNSSTNAMFIEKIDFENNFPQNLVVHDLNKVIPKSKKK